MTEGPAPAACPCSTALTLGLQQKENWIHGLYPKSQRKVLEDTLIFLTLRSELVFACEHLQSLVNMQILFLISEAEQTG